MTTYIALEDGRVFGTSNAIFDEIIEHVVNALSQVQVEDSALPDWLLSQRCAVQGPGVGYLDLRELAPESADAFRNAAELSFRKLLQSADAREHTVDQFSLLVRMWESIDNGEPPEALTCDWMKLSPPSKERRGPGW